MKRTALKHTSSTSEMEKKIKELEEKNKELEEEKLNLEQQVEYWKKRFFVRMSEKKHLPVDPSQLSLFSEQELAQLSVGEQQQIAEEAQKQEEVITKAVSVKKKPARKSLDSKNLPIREEHLYPEGTTDDNGNLKEEYVEIGTDVSERIEMVPATAYVKRTVRHKVMLKGQMALGTEERKIQITPLPQTPIEKGIPGATLLADILLSKFLYHLPFYRSVLLGTCAP